MSEILATTPLPGEASTVEGRLADMMETAEIHVDGYRLSEHDRSLVVGALRYAHSLKSDPVTAHVATRSDGSIFPVLVQKVPG